MKITALLMLITLNVAVLGIGPAIAGQVGTLIDFKAGTPAVADDVDANFDDIKKEVNDNNTRISTNATNITANASKISTNASALPLMWASVDSGYSGVSVAAGSGLVEVNNVSITAPANGYLVLSGNIFINNYATASDLFALSPYIDGVQVLAYESAAATEAQAGGTDGSLISLAYTVTVAITSGAHTVSQNIESHYNDGNYFYNRNNMTILFIHSSQGESNSALNAKTMEDMESVSPNGIK